VSFARTIRLGKASPALSVLEKSGDPNALAAEFVKLTIESEESPIGRPRGSSLYDACMRMHVIGTKEKVRKVQWDGTRDRLIFGIGNALHYWVQNTGDVLGDKRVGWWRCEACGSTMYFGEPPKRKCTRCGARKEAIRYHEHTIDMRRPWPVTGHPDMFVIRSTGNVKLLRVVEVKTIDGDSYESLVAPLIAHQWQLQTYMWACSIDQTIPMQVDSAVGYLLYISKKTREKQLPFKVYPVVKDPLMLTRIQAKLTQYSYGMKGYPNSIPKVLADCERSDFAGSRAKFCPVLQHCKRLHEKGSSND